MSASDRVRLRRIYDEPARSDGARVLVDGIWPRGVAKDEAAVDRWLRGVAPSRELRRWFGHDPDRFVSFRERYRAELSEGGRSDALTELVSTARERRLTLLTATRDVDHSHARVLVDEVRDRLER